MKTNNLQGHLTRTSLLLALLAPLSAAALSVLGSSIPVTFQEPLSEDTDAGAIIDREGVAGRKAVLASRWGPADARWPKPFMAGVRGRDIPSCWSNAQSSSLLASPGWIKASKKSSPGRRVGPS